VSKAIDDRTSIGRIRKCHAVAVGNLARRIIGLAAGKYKRYIRKRAARVINQYPLLRAAGATQKGHERQVMLKLIAPLRKAL
jgi:hypothetical protein